MFLANEHIELLGVQINLVFLINFLKFITGDEKWVIRQF